MHELKAVLAAAADLHARGALPVLATVVDVKGSVYRRPGAHMLIAQGISPVGSISGGCLERDVAERASELLQGGPPQLLTYDSLSGEDVVWGLGLGCNGRVSILLEPLKDLAPLLAFWQECLAQRRPGVVATVFASTGPLAPGARSYYPGGQSRPDFPPESTDDAARALEKRQTTVKHYGDCSLLLELVAPPTRLVICGAGPDAIPVVRLAAELGWEVTIIDKRPGYATREFFPEAHEIIVGSTLPADLKADDAAVVMAHHFQDDREFLRQLLNTSVGYLGVLGPRARTASFLEQLGMNVGLGPHLKTSAEREPPGLRRIYAPVGLDIGAETPEAIALSIVAEIRAVLAGRPAGFLRERSGPIHPAVE